MGYSCGNNYLHPYAMQKDMYKRRNTKAYASPARQSATVMEISGHTHSEEF